jgi:hypothetical protein
MLAVSRDLDPAEELAELAASLATQGVYIGTSSWKLTGWFGTI